LQYKLIGYGDFDKKQKTAFIVSWIKDKSKPDTSKLIQQILEIVGLHIQIHTSHR